MRRQPSHRSLTPAQRLAIVASAWAQARDVERAAWKITADALNAGISERKVAEAAGIDRATMRRRVARLRTESNRAQRPREEPSPNLPFNQAP